MQKTQIAFYQRHLDPIKKIIPNALKNYLSNNANRIDFGTLAPSSRVKIQKYLFYSKAVSCVQLLIEKTSRKLQQMQKEAEVTQEEHCFKKPLPKKRKTSTELSVQPFTVLPNEIIRKILGLVDISTLCKSSLIDKKFYQLAGNDSRWKLLSKSLNLNKSCKLQTWKNVYAHYLFYKRNVGDNVPLSGTTPEPNNIDRLSSTGKNLRPILTSW